jgi:hypothetical protein
LNREDVSAGPDWLKDNHHPELSLQKLEPMPAAWVVGFNKAEVPQFLIYHMSLSTNINLVQQ